MIYYSIDIETTGLNPMRNSVIQFAAVKAHTMHGEIARFYREIWPNDMTWDSYCLTLHSVWLAEVLSKKPFPGLRGSLQEVAIDFKDWLLANAAPSEYTNDVLRPITVAGKNFGAFDLQFLMPAFGRDKMFRIRYIDVGNLYFDLEKDEGIPDLKECKARAIHSGCKTIGQIVHHNALADAKDIVELVTHATYLSAVAKAVLPPAAEPQEGLAG